MKFDKLDCVTAGELRRMLGELIGKLGNQYKAADAMNVSQSMVTRVIRGSNDVGRKIPAYFGLTPVTVYVAKKTNQNKA